MSAFLGIGVVVISVAIALTLHIVPEGHVGVYVRGGRLLDFVSEPGLRMKIPFFTAFTAIDINLQTDKVENIPCGTSGGVLLTFDSIEVVNKLNKSFVLNTLRNFGTDYDKVLIYDKIHHLVNSLCSTHTLHEVYISEFSKLDEMLTEQLQEGCDKWETGIEIIAVRVTKPRIPYALALFFIHVEHKF